MCSGRVTLVYIYIDARWFKDAEVALPASGGTSYLCGDSVGCIGCYCCTGCQVPLQAGGMCQVTAGTCLCSSCPRGHFVGPGVCKDPRLSCCGLPNAGLPAIAVAVKRAWAGLTDLVTDMLRGSRREVARQLAVRPNADGALLAAENGACRVLTLQ